MQQIWMLMMLFSYVCTYDMAPCTNALGCYSGEIPNEAFSASSFKGADFKPSNARVRLDKSGGAWCPDNPIMEGSAEFLQISLQSLTLVTMVETQGRFAEGKGHEFTDRLRLQYFRGGRWYHYARGKIINANVNTYQNELITLNPPIVLSKLRFLPYSEKEKEVCLRVEVYGCLWKGGLLSYTAPEGDLWRAGGLVVSYRDAAYDGTMQDGVMHGGLGLLADGKHSDYEASNNNNKPTSNSTWLAWKRRRKDVELLFEFEDLRNFSHVVLHTWDNGKDARAFKSLIVHFLPSCHVPQQHNQQYNSIKVTTTSHPHSSHHNIKVINVSLSYSVASCLKISLESSSRWIFLSEVTFVSEGAKEVAEEGGESWKGLEGIKHENQQVEEEVEEEDEEEGEEELEKKDDENRLKTASQSSQSQERIGILAGSIVTVFVLLLVLLVALLLSRRKQIKKYKQPHNDLLSTHGPLNEGEFAYQKSRSIKNSKLPSPPISAFHQSSQPIKFQQAGHITDCLTNQAFNSTLRPKTTLKRPKPLPPPDEFHVALNNNTTYKNIHNTTYNNINNKIVDNLIDNDNFLHNNNNLFNKSLLIDNDDNNNDNNWLATTDKQPTQIPRDAITFLTHVGEGVFSQVNHCQLHGKEMIVFSYDLRSSVQREAMDRKVQRLLNFQDCSTLAQLVGVNMEVSPAYVLLESSSDLHTFLNQHPSLTYGSLIYMSSQIASGLKHLEMRGVVHGDVGCRTCAVFNNLHVKLSDTQACKSGPFSHHYYLDPRTSTMLPIRWMAWEAYLYNNQSSKSDVWMFGVTLWEILNMAKQRPFNDMGDKMVIENMRLMGKQDDIYTCIDNKVATLPQPPCCPKETYDLIKECCNVDCEVRPSFQDVHRFLQMNNSGFNIQSDLSVHV